MQRFGHIFGFFWIRDVLGGLVDVAWAITGPRKQWGLAKYIAKPSKQQKSKSRALVPPSVNSKNDQNISLFSHQTQSKFQIDLTRSIFTSMTNPFGFRTGWRCLIPGVVGWVMSPGGEKHQKCHLCYAAAVLKHHSGSFLLLAHALVNMIHLPKLHTNPCF